MIVEDTTGEIVSWCSDALDADLGDRVWRAWGIVRDQRLAGAAVLHNARRYDMELSMCGTVTRGLVKVIASAVREANVGRLSVQIRRTSFLRRHLPRLGFTFEGVTRHYYGPARENDALRYGILTSEWEARHG